MHVDGTYHLKAKREVVYDALINPEILRRCIPGCESLEKTGGNLFTATMKAGIGSIKGTFKGDVRLEETRPPEQYRIVVNGKGMMGFAKGSADFELEQQADGTLIKYTGEMQIGGTIAGVGQRMVQSAARTMAGRFFAALESEVQKP